MTPHHPPGGEALGPISLVTCGVSTVWTFAGLAQSAEPVVTLLAGIIAIVSGLLGGVHYVMKIWDRLQHGPNLK